MRTTFEQPKYLNSVIYQRVVCALSPVIIVYGLIISALVLLTLWRRAEAGQHIPALRWVLSATSGLVAAGLIVLAWRFEMSRRRYIEFRDNGVYLARRGVVVVRRFVAWSLSADAIEPRYTQLRLTYRFGFGRKHWSMILDDAAEISELRDALTVHVPPKGAT